MSLGSRLVAVEHPADTETVQAAAPVRPRHLLHARRLASPLASGGVETIGLGPGVRLQTDCHIVANLELLAHGLEHVGTHQYMPGQNRQLDMCDELLLAL